MLYDRSIGDEFDGAANMILCRREVLGNSEVLGILQPPPFYQAPPMLGSPPFYFIFPAPPSRNPAFHGQPPPLKRGAYELCILLDIIHFVTFHEI